MAADFIGLSRTSLQDAKLSRLARIANLRKESKHLRESLWAVRSELAEARHELTTIDALLCNAVVEFPAPAAEQVPVDQPKKESA